MIAVKRYDAGSRLNDMNRVIGHYCAGEKPCTHCEYGYPFSYPLTWQIVSDKTLCVLHEHALKQIEEAVGALRSIEAERGARDA